MLSAFSSKASISDGMGCKSAYSMGNLRVLDAFCAQHFSISQFKHVLCSLCSILNKILAHM